VLRDRAPPCARQYRNARDPRQSDQVRRVVGQAYGRTPPDGAVRATPRLFVRWSRNQARAAARCASATSGDAMGPSNAARVAPGVALAARKHRDLPPGPQALVPQALDGSRVAMASSCLWTTTVDVDDRLPRVSGAGRAPGRRARGGWSRAHAVRRSDAPPPAVLAGRRARGRCDEPPPRANLAEAAVCVAVESAARESSRRRGEEIALPAPLGARAAGVGSAE
jgi:hypothetical protein